MTAYTVIWHRRAVLELAAVWLHSTDRNGVTQATAEVDRQLAAHPLLIGAPRASSVQRIALCPPVGVEYEVIEDDKKVVVRSAFAAH